MSRADPESSYFCGLVAANNIRGTIQRAALPTEEF